MRNLTKTLAVLVLCTLAAFNAGGQTHSAIGLDNDIYYLLEQCALRGLCAELPPTRPWTRGQALALIHEALGVDAGSRPLSAAERVILDQYRTRLENEATGLRLPDGEYYNRAEIGDTGVDISGRIGVGLDVEGSAGVGLDGSNALGLETWVNAFIGGDVGDNFSYRLSVAGGIIRAPRNFLGIYHTYYPGYAGPPAGEEYADRVIDVYSQPLSSFPYAYRKRWDGSIHFLNDSGSFQSWPDDFAMGYSERFDLAGSFLEDRLFFRLGRLEHDWGVTPKGSSLAFNQAARPFLGIEGSFRPLSWFSISTLTGILEYFNEQGIKASAMTSQNAFSISMLEFKYKNYLFMDLGQGNIWPKRLELGYLSSFASFYYQNNVGDFDNAAYFMNFKAQYPGIGSIWASLFFDEATFTPDLFVQDRIMWSYQGGVEIALPFLPFSSLKVSYTKVEPYCFTHNIITVPWYPQPMEQAYTNNGVGLGYYLPPNADEILLRLETRPAVRTSAHFQYQMIRHGADFGDSAVDGSSLLSELDPGGRNSNPVLYKYFLQDGAYQWFHVLKLGAGHTLALGDAAPFRLYGEAGVVFSYFTNIDGPPNTGSPAPYHWIDRAPYTPSTAFIFTLGVRVFPRL
jgi:hypothetical protein